MTQLKDYLPQPTTWFEEEFSYKGIGRIEFSNPQGWLEGEMTCVVNGVGEMSVVFVIQGWENSEEPNNPSSESSLDWLVSGVQLDNSNDLPWKIYPSPAPARNHIVSADFKTTEGGNLTSERIPYYTWDPIEKVIELYIDGATYIAGNQAKTNAVYWILPCINLDLNHLFGTTQSNRYKNLRRHPLRIFPVTYKTERFLESDAPEQEKAWILHNLAAMSYIVGFFYNDKPAFIERLPNYEQITHDLRDGIARLGVTSVMIGVFSSEEDEIHPIDLLPILGLATGRPVGASWIEFRDQSANLVYRIHANFGRYTYGNGRLVVNDIMHQGGLGKLLTEAARSPILPDPLVLGALRNCAKAISGEDITTIFFYAFTALNALFTYYKIKQKIHPLKSTLTQIQISEIENILSKAKKDIESLATQVADPHSSTGKQQTDVINKVAGKVRSQPLETSTQFGDELIALLQHLGFSDVDVISTYYPNVDIWKDKVTTYRATTMHETHYRDVFNLKTRQDVEQIMPHLIDILIRVLLKTVGYAGNYAPYMDLPNSSEAVSWVTSSTSARYLGYK